VVTTSWAQLVGSWSDQSDSWAELGPKELLSEEMMFLGVDENTKTALHYENQASFTNFGVPFTPRWTSPSGESQNQIGLATTNAIRMRYTSPNLAEINLFLPDNVGQFEQVNQLPVQLTATTQRRLIQNRSLWTGLDVGLRIEVLSGDPEFHEFGLDVMPRSSRVDPGYTFTPREYEADF
jgi:aminoglycoside N3'-acetyltransferase